MFQPKVAGEIKTLISFFSIIFFPENLTLFEMMLKSIIEPDMPQMTVWHMRIAYWLLKATNAHSECVILIAFPLQLWLHESAKC